MNRGMDWKVLRAFVGVALLASACGQASDDIGIDPEDDASWASADELGEVEGSLVSCSNLDGTNSVMAAMAVAAAQDLGRWQPKRDLTIARTNGQREASTGGVETIKLTSTGKAQCADGRCARLQALLDLQYDSAVGVTLPGNVVLNPPALRSRTVAKLREQFTCEAQPSNGGTSNCPVEEHKLTFQYSSPGACDTNFHFRATTPTGTALKYPAQLKNKLLWADRTNPYVAFASVGDVVSIDPTFGLNELPATTSGACSATCIKISLSDEAGECCSCLGVQRTFRQAPWNANTYLCR